MRRIVLSRLRLQWARYVLIGLCVAVSAAFATASLMLSTTMNASMVGTIAEGTKNADLVAAPDMTNADLQNLAAFPTIEEAMALGDLAGVDSVWPQVIMYTAIEGRDPNDGGLGLGMAPEDADVFPWEVTEGSLPTEDGQVLLSQTRAEALDVGVGDSITVASIEVPMDAGAAGEDASDLQVPESVSLTVSGVAEASDMTSSAQAWVTESQLMALSPVPADQLPIGTEIQFKLTPDADVESVRSDLTAALEQDSLSWEVLTPQEQSDRLLEQMSGESNITAAFLLAFALLAGIVAFLVITTTFGVLTAQRAKELALLRCLGATGSQLRRSVLLEALMIGIIASALGVAAVVGLAFALSPLFPDWVYVAVATRDVLVGLLLGVIITALASIGPARRAMQASPLDGMRGSRASDRIPWVRSGIGLVLFLTGAAALAWAAVVQDQAIIGIIAGAATGLGLVLTSRLWMPAIVRILGKLLPGRTASTLAAANASRHPARTTSTVTALLIGITLVATVLTGHAVAQRSVLTHLDEQNPVDVSISETVDQDTLGEIAMVDHVTNARVVDGATEVDLQQGLGSRATSTAVGQIADLTDQDAMAIGAAAYEKSMFVDILNIMLAVALGLLGASVLVSVLGIASTMSLSVMERTRENSLLRALGLSRKQLASTIRREALIIASAACVAGVAAGWLMGTAVVRAMVTDSLPVLITVPWVGFIAVIIGGWLTALLAAALPTRRATRVSPVEGLAAVD